ncbi:MAG: hypothetical protein WC627_10405 [Legionella sp.]|jgi:hypothetical protein
MKIKLKMTTKNETFSTKEELNIEGHDETTVTFRAEENKLHIDIPGGGTIALFFSDNQLKISSFVERDGSGWCDSYITNRGFDFLKTELQKNTFAYDGKKDKEGYLYSITAFIPKGHYQTGVRQLFKSFGNLMPKVYKATGGYEDKEVWLESDLSATKHKYKTTERRYFKEEVKLEVMPELFFAKIFQVLDEFQRTTNQLSRDSFFYFLKPTPSISMDNNVASTVTA